MLAVLLIAFVGLLNDETLCANHTECPRSRALTENELIILRNQTVQLFKHAFNAYMAHAFPADELMPLSCRGRYRVGNSRGDIDDVLGNYSLTLIDSLDTLAMLGLYKEFEDAVKYVINNVTFDTDVTISFFEANIRVVGGLLGAHVAALNLPMMTWYRNELLIKAGDMIERLSVAFDTPTGLPLPRINLRKGKEGLNLRLGKNKVTCTACAGTLLDMFVVAKLLKKEKIAEMVTKALDFIWSKRNLYTDLVGSTIDVVTGSWMDAYASIGAGSDSYYEYLLKTYIVTGNATYMDRFNSHYAGFMTYLTNDGRRYRVVNIHDPWIIQRTFMDSLIAYFPAAQVLAGLVDSAAVFFEHLHLIALSNTFLPEAFTGDGYVYWKDHLLRPELIESAYALFKATGDPYYQLAGKDILTKIEKYARVPCGLAAIKDVRTLETQDRLDSFVFAETFKYLYLLFGGNGPESRINADKFVFSSEAHLIPILSSSITSRNISNFVTPKLPNRSWSSYALQMMETASIDFENKRTKSNTRINFKIENYKNKLIQKNESLDVDYESLIDCAKDNKDCLDFAKHLQSKIKLMVNKLNQQKPYCVSIEGFKLQPANLEAKFIPVVSGLTKIANLNEIRNEKCKGNILIKQRSESDSLDATMKNNVERTGALGLIITDEAPEHENSNFRYVIFENEPFSAKVPLAYATYEQGQELLKYANDDNYFTYFGYDNELGDTMITYAKVCHLYLSPKAISSFFNPHNGRCYGNSLLDIMIFENDADVGNFNFIVSHESIKLAKPQIRIIFHNDSVDTVFLACREGQTSASYVFACLQISKLLKCQFNEYSWTKRDGDEGIEIVCSKDLVGKLRRATSDIRRVSFLRGWDGEIFMSMKL